MSGEYLVQFGAVLCFLLAAFGSSMGILVAAQAAAGAWARDAKSGVAMRFSYIIFIGAPISQTFYAMIVMNQLRGVLSNAGLVAASSGLLFGIGLTTGIGELASAWGQGLIGASACRCLSEGEGKGLAFLLIAIGIIETVGIFTMVFMLGMVPRP